MVQSNYWTPPRTWDNEASFLIGGGSSLKSFDFSLLKGCYVVGCNDAFRLGPEIIKYNIFGDAGWWIKYSKEIQAISLPFVTNCTSQMQDVPNLYRMKRIRDGLHSGDTLGWNFSTGASAINLALSLGSTCIYLLGYDLCNGNNDVSHWHEHNPRKMEDFTIKRFLRGFATVFNSLPRGAEVLNVTDGSSQLPDFKRISFEDFYNRIGEKKQELVTA